MSPARRATCNLNSTCSKLKPPPYSHPQVNFCCPLLSLPSWNPSSPLFFIPHMHSLPRPLDPSVPFLLSSGLCLCHLWHITSRVSLSQLSPQHQRRAQSVGCPGYSINVNGNENKSMNPKPVFLIQCTHEFRKRSGVTQMWFKSSLPICPLLSGV
jgi:hypothetical protein